MKDKKTETEKKSDIGEKKKGNKKTKKLLIVLLAAYLVLVACAAAVVDARHVRFYLTGAQRIDLEYGETYSDPGVYAVTTGRLFGESPKRLEVTSHDDIDPSKLGSYTVTYTAKYAFQEYSTERTVNIADTTPPTIELKHTDNYQYDWFTGYQEEGFTAADNYDGDLTDKVQRTEEPGKVIYTVTDSSGNKASEARELGSVTQPPTLTLRGDAQITIGASMDFSDPGFAAVDQQGNDLSSHVQISGEVVPYIAGVYELSYSLTNSRGESITATRTVTVVPRNNPETVDPSGKTIYLTFDDGPGPYTSGLLDMLSKYNVKVTFFVTGANEKYYNQIGRAYREGHSIGVHTYSHNYRNIYSSEEAFFNDFYTMQDIINDQTGSYTNLYRFPGGSSNTVSSFNPGIISTLASALNDLGYSYFDWNVSSGDAGETTKTASVAQNIIDGCSQRQISVVLQHDIKDYSVAAVEKVILWGLENGYTFRALNQSSPTAHHSIAN